MDDYILGKLAAYRDILSMIEYECFSKERADLRFRYGSNGTRDRSLNYICGKIDEIEGDKDASTS